MQAVIAPTIGELLPRLPPESAVYIDIPIGGARIPNSYESERLGFPCSGDTAAPFVLQSQDASKSIQ